MTVNCASRLAILLLTGSFWFGAAAATIYDEGISGDLSTSGLSPTTLSVLAGSNQVFGTTGNSGGVDRDYFTLTVPVGLQLSAITLLPGTTVGGAFSFFGVQAGNQVTLPTSPADATGLLGWWHYSVADINTDLLGKMSIASNGSSGFTPPLEAGNYAFWIQDFSPGSFSYGLDITLRPAGVVPEPGTAGALFGGLAALMIGLRIRSAR